MNMGANQMADGLISHDPKGEHYLRAFKEAVTSLVKYYDSDFGHLRALWGPENYCRLFTDAYMSNNLTVDELEEMISYFCRGYIKFRSDESPPVMPDSPSNSPVPATRIAAHMIVASNKRRFIFKNSASLWDVPYSRFDGEFCAKFFWERHIQTLLISSVPEQLITNFEIAPTFSSNPLLLVFWLEERGFVKEETLGGQYISRTFRLSFPENLESTCAMVVPPNLFEDERGRIRYDVLLDGVKDSAPLFMESVCGGYAFWGIVEVVGRGQQREVDEFCEHLYKGIKNRDFYVWVPSSFLVVKGIVPLYMVDVKDINHDYFVVGGDVRSVTR
jgi:hypothetical protein